MLRKTLLGAATSIALLPQVQLSYAGAGADVAAPMRWAAAANETNPAQRCANIYGSQYWFLEYPPNCAPLADQTPR
jgi:hypothetical protein